MFTCYANTGCSLHQVAPRLRIPHRGSPKGRPSTPSSSSRYNRSQSHRLPLQSPRREQGESFHASPGREPGSAGLRCHRRARTAVSERLTEGETDVHLFPTQTRYDTMRYNRCGRSGLKLPAISLGLWHNFGGVDEFENARGMIWRAFDLGITHFDLANNYGPPPGSAEENFGKILRQDLRRYPR